MAPENENKLETNMLDAESALGGGYKLIQVISKGFGIGYHRENTYILSRPNVIT